jgi:hypothetical protein
MRNQVENRSNKENEMTAVSQIRCVAVLIAALTLCCGIARAGLIHRYSFTDGAKDSVGKIDGTLKGDAKVADGKLVLNNGGKGSDDPKLSYLEFGAPLIPKGGSVSLVAWVTSSGSYPYARVVDIGNSEGGVGEAFIYIVARHDEDKSRGAITASDTDSKTMVSGDPLDDGKPHMAVLVIDGDAKKLRMYIDGKQSAPAEDLGQNTLDKVKPVHNWLGRSAFDENPGLSASIDEFRVYDHALSTEEVGALQKAGPDKLP